MSSSSGPLVRGPCVGRGGEPCGLGKTAAPGCRGMCRACHRATRRREIAAEEGREIKPRRRPAGRWVSVSVALPAELVERLDALGHKTLSEAICVLLQERLGGP